MAEIAATNNRSEKRAGTPNRSRLSTRIDLTPMVDLGFLLITFFLFTTTLAKPKVMTVNMPFKSKDTTIVTKWSESCTMTILLSKDHNMYYYQGVAVDPSDVKFAGFNGSNSIRDAIIQKKLAVKALKEQGVIRANSEAAFLVKPDTNSTYEDFVQIMDELNINDVTMKAVVDITAEDQALIAKTNITRH